MNNLITYTKGCKDTQGDLKRVYLAKFVDYDETQILLNADTVTTFPSTIIYKFDVEGSYNQSTELQGGAVGWNQDININLNKVYNVIDSHTFQNQKFRLIAETNNGIYLMFGLFNGLDCALNNATGESKETFNGFSLIFAGLEENAASIIDINDFIIFDDTLYFNYNFIFNI